MSSQALFVDLPNFYSHLLESGTEEPRLLRDYFLDWLDFDRLAEKLTGSFSSVWVFYSGRRFGPRANRIHDQYLDSYIARTNALRGVTARDVDIEGKQREQATYECEKCGHRGVAQWETEKGIDASLIVHLFDTMETWDIAYLLSGDADFVPAVASLRRPGKIVIGAGFSHRSSALVQECYDYVDLCELFLREDVAAYMLFRDGGIIQRWLTDEVRSRSDNSEISLTFEWQAHVGSSSNGMHLLSINEISKRDPSYYVYLIADGPIDLSLRHQLLVEFQATFPDNVVEMKLDHGQYQLIISPLAWNGVARRLHAFTSSLRGVEVYEARVEGNGYTIKYRYDPALGRYEIISN